jgi:hypothetical protein
MEGGAFDIYCGHSGRRRYRNDAMGLYGPPNDLPNQDGLPGALSVSLFSEIKGERSHIRTHLLVQ